MKLVAAFVAAVALFGAAQAADVDNGFTQDGTTTYCMGVTGSVGTLNFDSLEASNVGRCPVGLTLTLTGSEFHMNDPISVKWTAKANVGLANSIFPNAIDAATSLPSPVTTSALFACTAGTNCATNVGGTPTGQDGSNSGAFNADGTKALETNTFTLPTAGDYIIAGIVALPATTDPTLNLAAEEYVIFKKISVVSADSAISSSSKSTTGSVGSSESSGSEAAIVSTTAPPVTTAPPLTMAPSSSIGSSHSDSTSNSANDATSAPGSHSGTNSTSSAEQDTQSEADSSKKLKSDTTTDSTTPATSDDTTQQNDTGSSDAAKSASTSSSSGGFGSNSVIIVAALVGCCIVGVVGFAFVMRRRKEQRMNANKAFDINSPSLASEMDDSALGGHNGGKIDLTYVANISARNNDRAAENIMSEESSVAIMASAERGSELNSSNASSLHSLPKSSLDTDEYSEKVSYGATGATTSNEAEIDAYRMSNMSDMSIGGGGQSEASSMSNFGDSVVSARQNKYLNSEHWNDSESSRMDSRLDSMEQAELKARGFGSIGGFSTVSGFSEDGTSRITGMSDQDSNRDIGFSMSSRPTVESRFTEDYNVNEDRATVESRFTEEYRATEESRVTEDSRATGFSEAMDQSRLQSEVSVDSYGFRASRSSADSYSSGMSPYSRESSRISGFSVDSDRVSNASSKY
ncbi:hypothetical protein PHMEG_0001195 [Phytophthora megakarya]|uniref:Uncharacterized protein n=1 Tax=Phytophthora megakarya TaxID=4795 RepID=A0A225X3S5_9STRA|nr:hypothetical protein PHMEG_0001195 [Phytophthora megakarya]